MTNVLYLLGFPLVCFSLVGTFMRLLPQYVLDGIAGIGNSLLALWAIRKGFHFNAELSTACATLNFYLWWHRGGGGGTKRRLRSLRRRFTPVRRTAPQGV